MQTCTTNTKQLSAPKPKSLWLFTNSGFFMSIAHGVKLTCNPNHMQIVLPKNLIHNLGHEHLSLLDPTCRANGNATHYSLSTSVTECGTQSHVFKNFIVYTNRVLESPNEDSDVITHVGKNEIKVLDHRNLVNSRLIKNNWVKTLYSKVIEMFIEASDIRGAG